MKIYKSGSKCMEVMKMNEGNADADAAEDLLCCKKACRIIQISCMGHGFAPPFLHTVLKIICSET